MSHLAFASNIYNYFISPKRMNLLPGVLMVIIKLMEYKPQGIEAK